MAVYAIISLTISVTSLAKVITFFVKPYPGITQQAGSKRATKLDKKQSTNQERAYQFVSPAYTGVFATYSGYLTISDRLGQITFPRRQQANFVDLIVTRRLVPVTLLNRIIHHWEIPPHEPASWYSVRFQKDSETKLDYWEVTKQTVPKDGIIPLRSIVIFAHPESVYIPTGITLAPENQNLILPTVYLKKSFETNIDATRALSIRKFFETPQLLYQMIPYGYAQQLFTFD